MTQDTPAWTEVASTRLEASRCPGGYLIRGNALCGPTGNRCKYVCAFAYRRARNPENPDAS